jgi:hypothetical protein
MTSIDGPFANLYECGVFIASVATADIIHSSHPNRQELADAFNLAWVRYLSSSYKVDGAPPTQQVVVASLQKRWRDYEELLRACLSAPEGEARTEATVQLAWDLFTNCTGKAKPQGLFLNLVGSSPKVLEIAIRTIRWTRDWLGPAPPGV